MYVAPTIFLMVCRVGIESCMPSRCPMPLPPKKDTLSHLKRHGTWSMQHTNQNHLLFMLFCEHATRSWRPFLTPKATYSSLVLGCCYCQNYISADSVYWHFNYCSLAYCTASSRRRNVHVSPSSCVHIIVSFCAKHFNVVAYNDLFGDVITHFPNCQKGEQFGLFFYRCKEIPASVQEPYLMDWHVSSPPSSSCYYHQLSGTYSLICSHADLVMWCTYSRMVDVTCTMETVTISLTSVRSCKQLNKTDFVLLRKTLICESFSG